MGNGAYINGGVGKNDRRGGGPISPIMGLSRKSWPS